MALLTSSETEILHQAGEILEAYGFTSISVIHSCIPHKGVEPEHRRLEGIPSSLPILATLALESSEKVSCVTLYVNGDPVKVIPVWDPSV